MTARKRPAPPKETVTITFAITETPTGKLDINLQVPDQAAGTVALVLADAAIKVMREMLKDVGLDAPMEERRLQ